MKPGNHCNYSNYAAFSRPDRISVNNSGLKLEHTILAERLMITYHGHNIVDRIFYDKNYYPKIKVCTAMENQYVIDYSGSIYKCWWGMGNKDYEVGEISENTEILDEKKTKIYMNRSIFNLQPCSNCQYRYICGGACSGRLSREDLYSGKMSCPNFSDILKFVIAQEYKFSLDK